jgi:hypothetical protein
MDEFKKMNVVRSPAGEVMSIEEFSKLCYNGAEIEVFRNSIYQVIKRVYKGKQAEKPNLVWLSIKRIDKEFIHDWRELQEIKNLLVGKECEGLELYPAESRVVDTSNQYHIFVFDDPTFRLPFGFNERLVTDEYVAEQVGAKQRPFKKEEK